MRNNKRIHIEIKKIEAASGTTYEGVSIDGPEGDIYRTLHALLTLRPNEADSPGVKPELAKGGMIPERRTVTVSEVQGGKSRG